MTHLAWTTVRLQEYHTALHASYEGQYDNLLFYFMVHYKLIQVRQTLLPGTVHARLGDA